MWRLRAMSVVLSLVLVAVACGDDDDEEGAGTTSPSPSPTTTTAGGSETSASATVASTTGPTAPGSTAGSVATSSPESELEAVEGCEDGWTDDYSMDPDRPPPRCEPGFPAPVPLDTPVTLKVQVSSRGSENGLPVFLGFDKGEFEKENLTLELVQMGSGDAMQLLAQGDLDIVTNLTGGTFNLIDDGFPIRVIASGFYNHPDATEGLWSKAELEIGDLAGKTVAASVLATTAFYGSYIGFKEAGISFSDFQYLQVGTTDGALALQNGAADAAFVLGPAAAATGIAEDPNFHFLAPFYWPGEPDAGLLAGPSSADDPEKAAAIDAFVRAYVRTISTYLHGEYKTDPSIAPDIARVMETTEEELAQFPPYVWDWFYRDGTLTTMQEMFRDAEALEYECCIPEEEFLDRSVLERVLTTDGS